MQQIGDYLITNPWLWILFAVGFLCWICAVRLIFTSPKFLRKWLWFLFSLLNFSWSWNISSTTFVSIGIPLGAFYILWFWRFGRAPTQEELAKHPLPVKNAAGPKGTLAQRRTLFVAYILAAIASLIMGAWCLTGAPEDLMVSILGDAAPTMPAEFRNAFDMMRIPQALMGGALCGVFIFLSFRPYWWGKLLCVWAGISWLGFSGAMCLLSGYDSRLLWILMAGVIMLLAAILHQIADPRFGGTYPRNP